MKAWFEPRSVCLRMEAASILLRWVGVLTLGPQRSFLPQVWPSWGTDPFGWKEGAGLSTQCSLSWASLNLQEASTQLRWWGKEWAFFFFPKWDQTIYIFLQNAIFILIFPYIYVCVCVCVYIYTHTHTHTHIYMPVLKLCNPPLYSYSVYYLFFSRPLDIYIVSKVLQSQCFIHIHLCKNIFEQIEVFLQDRFLEVASMGQGYACFKFLWIVPNFPPKRLYQFTVLPAKYEHPHSFTSLPLGII